MKPRPLTRRSRRGAALLIAILVLLVMTIAGIALMFNSSTENALAGNETRMSKAFYAADSGIQYGAARMANDINFVGGPLPGGMASNTAYRPGQPTPPAKDIDVTVSQPITLGHFKRPGDPFPSAGSSDPDIVETVYRIDSTANSDEIRASKVIQAQVTIYPQERAVR